METISARLRALPQQIVRQHYRHVMEISRRVSPFNLEELFTYLNMYCWNCFEYELLRFVIESNKCRKPLRNAMERYAGDIATFREQTTISEFIEHCTHLLENGIGPEVPQFRTLDTKLDINPNECTLARLDHFRAKICLHLKLSTFAFQVYHLRPGCVEIVWLVPMELSSSLIDFFCDEDGCELLQQYQVNKVLIDGIPMHSVGITYTCTCCHGNHKATN